MTMAPPVRKATLVVHITCSVGWVGAAAAYLALGVCAGTSSRAPLVRASWLAMELVGWWVLVPLALASLLTGVLVSLGTPWGLLRHWWVVFTLGLTVVAAGVLLLHMPAVTATADTAGRTDAAGVLDLGGDVLHPALGLVALLVITVLNVYKPRGLTPWGRRAQDRAHPGPPRTPDAEPATTSSTPTPR